MTNLLTNITGDNRSSAEEPPETPAPLFAVRALKSAFFGTPAPEKDKEDDDLQLPIVQHVSPEITNRPPSPTQFPIFQQDRLTTQKSKVEMLLSPAKGILLTPGTGTTRRKTVSFGALTGFNEGLAKSGIGQERAAAASISFSSNPSRNIQGNRRREAGLRRTLFDVQGKRSELALGEQGKPEEDQITTDPTYEAESLEVKATTDDFDITADLKHPLSRSGQHWKKEYQRDHENSKREMRKLIHYTQAAKSYAIKRDAEALDLSEKLKQALAESAEMETRVSQLASQLLNSAGQQTKTPSDQAELLSELAVHTANSLRYKQKAEKYKMAIQAQNTFAAGGKEQTQSDKSNPAPGIPQPSVVQPQKEFDQVESVSISEGQEILQLRNVAEMAESKAAALEKENLALKNTLSKVKQEMKAYEIRHQAREQRRKRKDEKAETQRLALKTELGKYRAMYQQKINSLAGQDTVAKTDCTQTTPPEVGTLKRHNVVDDLNERYPEYALPLHDENPPNLPPKTSTTKNSCPTRETSYQEKHWDGPSMRSSSLQESVDIWATSAEEPKGAHAPPSSTSPRDPSLVYDKSPLAELKHLLNEGHGHRVNSRLSSTNRIEKKLMESKPLEQVGVCTFPTAILANLDPAPVLALDSEKNCSQDQCDVNTAPKSSEASFQQHPLTRVPIQSRSNTLSRLLGNSRASSLSGRPPLPPGRAEAAKKRLVQRNAEVIRRTGHEIEQRPL